MKIIGPFQQIVSLENLYLKGKIPDSLLIMYPHAGILIDAGKIIKIDDFNRLTKANPTAEVEEIEAPLTLLPNFVDCHTHICYGGSRAQDFAMRNAGSSYLEIAEKGGGIWSSVQHTREAQLDELVHSTLQRIQRHISHGISTIEIKSGYGLDKENELKMLRAIQIASINTKADIIPTCLAAHMLPKDFSGSKKEYLEYVLSDILPVVQTEKLSNRVDIFVEVSAFSPSEALHYLRKAEILGFQSTVHADQFSSGGSKVAIEVKANSADHLEHSTESDLKKLAHSATVAVALPGASIGLGEPLTSARKILDYGGCLAIATDWNPGSAPQGNLLMQASILATYQKLSTAEVLSALTFRAAHALQLNDRGTLEPGKKADFHAYPTSDYREILYQQGMLTPSKVWIEGNLVASNLPSSNF